MNKIAIGTAIVAAMLLLGTAAQASPASDAFGTCLVQSSTGKDRVIFVRWFFNALSMNPNVQARATATPEQRAETTRQAADVFQRLVFVDCHAEALTAIRADGQQALETAFSAFGKSAANELMSDPAVAKELGALGNDTDNAKWTALMAEAKK